MKLSPESIARASSRRPWRTLVVWLLVFMAAGAASSQLLAKSLTNDFDFTNNPEAKQARTAIYAAFPGSNLKREVWVITSDTGSRPTLRSRCGSTPSSAS